MFQQYVSYLAGGLLITVVMVVLAYGVGRAFGFGFYRSKLEHVRRFLREINGGRR